MVEPTHPWPVPPTLEKHTSFPLHALTQQGKTADMELFFCSGLETGGTAYKIMTAAMTGNVKDMQAVLARMDALPDFENANGLTPLMVACARGHAQTADVLAGHPLVRLDRQSKDGWTALHYAAWMQRADIVDSLLTHLANPSVENSAGKTAYALGLAQNCASAFENNKIFIRAMKQSLAVPLAKPPPEAQKFQDAPQQEQPAPALENGYDKVFQHVMGLNAAAWSDDKDGKKRIALYNVLAACGELDFQMCFKPVDAARAEALDDTFWDSAFIAAARHGNVDVMRHIHRNIFLKEDTCRFALHAALSATQAQDMPDVVHHLLAWGAKAHSGCLYDTLRRMRPHMFEEMILWGKVPLDKTTRETLDTLVAGHLVKRKVHEQFTKKKPSAADEYLFTNAFEELLQVLNLAKEKDRLRAMRGGKLRKIFADAVRHDNINTLSAAYAEGRSDRFFRGSVEMDKDAGNTAVAVALLHDKFNLAVRLASDGFDIKKADPARLAELRSIGSEKAQNIAQKLERGQIDLTPIENICPKLPPAYYPMFTGRGGF